MAMTEIAADYGSDPSELSYWHFHWPWEYFDGDGGERIIKGMSLSKFVERLAAPIRKHIRLSKIVQAVEETEDSVKVKCKDGSNFKADVCIVTVPLGVLKKSSSEGGIEFIPPLPEEKSKVIARNIMG